MTFVPPTFTPSTAGDACDAVRRWEALEQAAGVVAALAAVEPEALAGRADELEARFRRADPWRRERAEAGVADLTAIMEPGLAALLAVNARGADPRPAAEALWREFLAARAAVLALLPPAAA
jgi:hypothetical protein